MLGLDNRRDLMAGVCLLSGVVLFLPFLVLFRLGFVPTVEFLCNYLVIFNVTSDSVICEFTQSFDSVDNVI